MKSKNYLYMLYDLNFLDITLFKIKCSGTKCNVINKKTLRHKKATQKYISEKKNINYITFVVLLQIKFAYVSLFRSVQHIQNSKISLKFAAQDYSVMKMCAAANDQCRFRKEFHDKAVSMKRMRIGGNESAF